jgi:hypothetical protein
MSVYFDNQIFYLQKFGGISRYFIELIKSLNDQQLCKAKLISPFSINSYLEELKNSHPHYFSSLPLFKAFNNSLLKRPDFYRRNYTKLFFNTFPKNILHETYYYHS